MAFTPKQRQTFDIFETHTPSREIVSAAKLILDGTDIIPPTRIAQVDTIEQLWWEDNQSRLGIRMAEHAFLIITLDRGTDPIHIPGETEHPLFAHSQLSYAISINEVNPDIPPLNAHIYAKDRLGRGFVNDSPESFHAFDQMFAHAAIAQTGLYQRIQSLQAA